MLGIRILMVSVGLTAYLIKFINEGVLYKSPQPHRNKGEYYSSESG